MDPEFWHQRWASRQIGFHEGAANALLQKHFGALGLGPGQRVFVPLCGKTRDIHWLLGRGCRVAGVELSAVAIEELFAELGEVPEIGAAGDLALYRTRDLEIHVGDFFSLSRSQLGPVDAIYDRAALVALPRAMRVRYATHLTAIAAAAPQLLITFEYEQHLVDGPPFSVSEVEVRQLYADRYEITPLASVEVPGGLKGRCAATETLLLLRPRGPALRSARPHSP